MQVTRRTQFTCISGSPHSLRGRPQAGHGGRLVTQIMTTDSGFRSGLTSYGRPKAGLA
jgi:hypothetical protein